MERRLAWRFLLRLWISLSCWVGVTFPSIVHIQPLKFRVERFLTKCRKTETKVIPTANQKKKILWRAKEKSKWTQPNCLKRGKTRATKSWLVLVLHLIGWKRVAQVFWINDRVEQTNVILDWKLPYEFKISFAWSLTWAKPESIITQRNQKRMI